MKKSMKIQILLESQKDKEDFLSACNHIRDFSVFWDAKTKKVGCIVDSFEKGPNGLSDMKNKRYPLKNPKSIGISLDKTKHKWLGVLASLSKVNEAELKKILIVRNKIKVGDSIFYDGLPWGIAKYDQKNQVYELSETTIDGRDLLIRKRKVTKETLERNSQHIPFERQK